MNRYRSYGQGDDQPQIAGDQAFLGVNEYDVPQNLQPGEVQKAVNIDFKTQAGATRGGFVCLPELGAQPFGQAWTYHAMGGSSNFRDVSYGQNLFVAVGSGVIKSSPDGITWTSRTPSVAAGFQDVAYANGKFIAVGSTVLGVTEPITVSTDGVTWSNPTTPFTGTMTGVSFGNGIWVTVGSQVSAVSSDNGDTWTKYTSIPSLALAQGLSYGNGVFFAAGIGSISTSSDGITWTEINLPTATIVTDVAFGNQLFVALDGGGRIFTSTDAVTWTKRRDSDGETWRTLTYGNGMFVAGAETAGGDGAMYSIDGITWIKMVGVPNYAWYGSTFGDGKFVMVGDAAASMIATNISQAIYASGLYSDPNNPGDVYVMLAAYDKVGFFAPGRTSKTISLGSNNFVTEQSTIVQANNEVYLFRGESQTPLYWDGNWNGTFAVVPNTTLPASFESIPNSKQATYYQDRLWVINGKDEIAASDVLEFQDYDPAANEITTNTGNSDYLVATFPFGSNSLIAFKNKSIYLVQNVSASLVDVANTEITRQVGLIGINAVCSVGPDLAYASYGNINLLTLTSTNNAVQHKTLPLSARIRKIMDRVNWEVGYKISMGYWNNKLYVALPLDNSIYCNGVVVYNFITQTWYGEWNFAESMNMCIQGFQVLDYLGLQRLHAITEDGRIFVTDEGQNDISGTTVAEISSELVTRAYMVQNLNHFQRRMFMDIGTNRPNFTVTVYTDGASEENTLITGQTYSRSESWKFNDSAYDLTNVNDDYNRAYRKDYSSGPLAAGSTSGLPTTGLQPQSGFQPEMLQEQRLPLITRRQGRLSWIKVQNTQGLLSMRTLGYETRPGQRSNLTQV
jgi:hypothetical protein